jgi:hypothetical protein
MSGRDVGKQTNFIREKGLRKMPRNHHNHDGSSGLGTPGRVAKMRPVVPLLEASVITSVTRWASTGHGDVAASYAPGMRPSSR